MFMYLTILLCRNLQTHASLQLTNIIYIPYEKHDILCIYIFRTENKLEYLHVQYMHEICNLKLGGIRGHTTQVDAKVNIVLLLVHKYNVSSYPHFVPRFYIIFSNVQTQ